MTSPSGTGRLGWRGPSGGAESPLDPRLSGSRTIGRTSRFAVSLLEAYKRWLSPYLPRSCRFTPTCSEYSRLAVLRYGLWRGAVLTTWRLARCHPLSPGGVDLP